MMSRYTKKIIISYDADEAGKKAADRAIQMLTEVGLDVTILRIPGAKDPDEYIKTYGADKFRSVLTGSKNRFEYHMESILSKYDISLPQDKVKALHESEKLISETYSSAERDIYIRIVAKKFDVAPQSIKSDVDTLVNRNARQRKKEESEKVKQDAVGYSDRVNPDFIKAPAAAKNEESLLGLLLLFPEHRKAVFDGKLISAEDFFTDLGKRVFTWIGDAYRIGAELPDLNDSFSPDEVGRITKMKISRMQLTDNGESVLNDCIDALKKSVSKKTSSQTNTYEGLNAILAKKRNV